SCVRDWGPSNRGQRLPPRGPCLHSSGVPPDSRTVRPGIVVRPAAELDGRRRPWGKRLDAICRLLIARPDDDPHPFDRALAAVDDIDPAVPNAELELFACAPPVNDLLRGREPQVPLSQAPADEAQVSSAPRRVPQAEHARMDDADVEAAGGSHEVDLVPHGPAQ